MAPVDAGTTEVWFPINQNKVNVGSSNFISLFNMLVPVGTPILRGVLDDTDAGVSASKCDEGI